MAVAVKHSKVHRRRQIIRYDNTRHAGSCSVADHAFDGCLVRAVCHGVLEEMKQRVLQSWVHHDGFRHATEVDVESNSLLPSLLLPKLRHAPVHAHAEIEWLLIALNEKALFELGRQRHVFNQAVENRQLHLHESIAGITREGRGIITCQSSSSAVSLYFVSTRRLPLLQRRRDHVKRRLQLMENFGHKTVFGLHGRFEHSVLVLLNGIPHDPSGIVSDEAAGVPE